MECSLLFCWIPVTTASSLLVMLSVLPPSILAGVSMVSVSFNWDFSVLLIILSWENWTLDRLLIPFSPLEPGSIWISSELKGLNDDCEHFECFPPGHTYSSKEGGLRRWYNPPWFSEAVPSTPYDPLALRRAFENVGLFHSSSQWEVILIFTRYNWDLLAKLLINAGCDQTANDWRAIWGSALWGAWFIHRCCNHGTSI